MLLSVSQDPMLAPLQHEPGILVMHLLGGCNLQCRHCYMDASLFSPNQLPLEVVLRTLQETQDSGVATIYLSGGEPFLYPELQEVLCFLADQSSAHVAISTNGTLIGAAQAEWAKAARATVQISLDGPEAYHDQFRGRKGAFASSSRAIDTLVSINVPVVLVTTICRDNLDCLPSLAKWAFQKGVERISVQPLLRLGRGVNLDNKQLSSAQLCSLFLQLSDLGHEYAGKGLAFSLAYRTRQFLTEHPCAAYVCDGAHCHRKVAKEIKKLVVREDGTVFPEIGTLNSRYALGNLSEGPLKVLVARYFAEGYSQFQQLCRTAYSEVMPTWTSPIVPWDEIISERSWLADHASAT